MKHMRKRIQFALVGLALLFLAQAAFAGGLDGKWNFTFYADDVEHPQTIILSVDGDQVTAKAANQVLRGTFRNGELKLSGDYYADEAGYEATLTISGKATGDEIKGTATWDSYDLTFIATREK